MRKDITSSNPIVRQQQERQYLWRLIGYIVIGVLTVGIVCISSYATITWIKS